jgi:hypothetical protein
MSYTILRLSTMSYVGGLFLPVAFCDVVYDIVGQTYDVVYDIIRVCQHYTVSTISSPGGTVRWLWNFRLGDVGRWHDSEPLSLGGPPGHNELGVQLEEFTSCFQYKKTDSEAAGPTRDNWSIQYSYPAHQATTAGD